MFEDCPALPAVYYRVMLSLQGFDGGDPNPTPPRKINPSAFSIQLHLLAGPTTQTRELSNVEPNHISLDNILSAVRRIMRLPRYVNVWRALLLAYVSEADESHVEAYFLHDDGPVLAKDVVLTVDPLGLFPYPSGAAPDQREVVPSVQQWLCAVLQRQLNSTETSGSFHSTSLADDDDKVPEWDFESSTLRLRASPCTTPAGDYNALRAAIMRRKEDDTAEDDALPPRGYVLCGLSQREIKILEETVAAEQAVRPGCVIIVTTLGTPAINENDGCGRLSNLLEVWQLIPAYQMTLLTGATVFLLTYYRHDPTGNDGFHAYKADHPEAPSWAEYQLWCWRLVQTAHRTTRYDLSFTRATLLPLLSQLSSVVLLHLSNLETKDTGDLPIHDWSFFFPISGEPTCPNLKARTGAEPEAAQESITAHWNPDYLYSLMELHRLPGSSLEFTTGPTRAVRYVLLIDIGPEESESVNARNWRLHRSFVAGQKLPGKSAVARMNDPNDSSDEQLDFTMCSEIVERNPPQPNYVRLPWVNSEEQVAADSQEARLLAHGLPQKVLGGGDTPLLPSPLAAIPQPIGSDERVPQYGGRILWQSVQVVETLKGSCTAAIDTSRARIAAPWLADQGKKTRSGKRDWSEGASATPPSRTSQLPETQLSAQTRDSTAKEGAHKKAKAMQQDSTTHATGAERRSSGKHRGTVLNRQQPEKTAPGTRKRSERDKSPAKSQQAKKKGAAARGLERLLDTGFLLGKDDDDNDEDPDPVEDEEDQDDHQVESILDYDSNLNKYEILWVTKEGEPPWEPTWEPARHVKHLRGKVMRCHLNTGTVPRDARLLRIWERMPKTGDADVEQYLVAIDDDSFDPDNGRIDDD